MIKRVVLYIRVSTEEQTLHGDSLEAQENALIEYAKQKGYKIVKIYRDEGYSARKPVLTRRAMKELIADAKERKFDLILFTKIDRWFRNVGDYHKVQEILEANKIYWKTILEDYDTMTADGRLKVNIMLSVAENEADRTSERIKFVNEMKIRKKEPVSGSQPFGYKISNEDGKKCIVKDPETEHIVNDMFDHFLTYHVGAKTTKYLNRKYDLNKSVSKINEFLKKSAYTGEYKGVPDYRPAYITREQHEEILRILDGKNSLKDSKVNRTYLFSGMIRCPECGRKLAVKIKTPYGRSKQYYYMYRCNSNLSGQCSFNHQPTEMKIERYLLNNIEAKLKEYEMKINIEENKEETLKPVRDRKKYEERLKRINNAYFLGNIEEDEYLRATSEIKSIIAEISDEKPKVDKKDIEELKRVITPNFREIYEGLTRENKRAVWLSIIKEIKVEGTEPVDIIFL